MKQRHESSKDRVRILVAEDSPTQVEQLRHLLEERDFAVSVARNGKEALALARKTKPHVVISDIVMPEMDGFTLCSEMKSDPGLRDVPVVLLTSLSSSQDVLKGLACGANNFVRKPYEDKYLIARLNHVLANQELRRSEKTKIGVRVSFAGQEYFIDSERQQILDLLISTYEDAVRLNDELQRGQKELASSYQILDGLHRIAVSLNAVSTEEETVRTALKLALELPGIRAGWILLRQEENGFRVAACRGLSADVDFAGPAGSACPCLRGLISGELTGATVITDCEPLRQATGASHGPRCHAAVPLRVRDQVFGIMNVVGSEQTPFCEEELKVLEGVGHQVAAALERSQRIEHLGRTVEERTTALAAERVGRARAEKESDRLFTLSADMFCIAGFDGYFKQLNPAWERTLGFTIQELLAKPFMEFVHPEDREATDAEAAKIRSGMQSVTFENRTLCKDGSYRWMLWSATASGEDQLYYGVARDITERKQLEQQFLQAQKMEAIGQLAGGIAHDFNNLLTIINGYSQLLLEGIGTDERLRNQVNEIKNAGERAAALTRQLLAFGRRQVLRPQVLDLNGVVSNMDKMLRRLIGEDIDLVTLCREGLGRVKADPGQIEQVIMNLAVNARDAMPRGGKLTLETADVELDENYTRNHVAVRPGRYVMLAVSDTGLGMDAETQAHIFEPFFTTKEQGKGTGLGLATVYGIVKQSGGNVWVYSESGRGTTFKIYLPRVDELADSASAATGQRQVPRGSETVLLVEDEDAVRALVRDVLESSGYNVLEANGATQALLISERYAKPIHVMLTDVVMPQMGGRELAARIASRHPETKVLYMSGYTDNAIVHHGVLDADTPFLQKPFAPDAVARKVREVLDGRA